MEKILNLIFVSFLLLTACSKDNSEGIKENIIEVTDIKLAKVELNLVEGDKVELKVNVIPENATDKNLIWTSSDENVAIVTQKGIVTALKAGQAEIKVVSLNNKSVICKLKVSNKYIPVTSLSFPKSSLELEKRKSLQLSYIILPDNATNKEVVWESEDSNFATVSSTGLVTALYAGDVKIYLSTKDGKIKASCKITIIDTDIKVKEVSLNKTSLNLKKGTSEQLIETIMPLDANNKYVYWTSADSNIATVSTTGLVSAISLGSTIITVTTADGLKMADCHISVEQEDSLDTFTDTRDSHIYKIITIGKQTWMAENFAYLPKVNLVGKDSYTESCYYVYDYNGGSTAQAKESENYKIYGVLYNHAAAIDACPDGWHLPSDEEWKVLEIHLGMPSDQAELENFSQRGDIASKFKSSTRWFMSKNGTNESGFNVYPSGKRNIDGEFADLSNMSAFWTSTKGNYDTNSYRREFSYYSTSITRSYKSTNKNGYSVRYIRN